MAKQSFNELLKSSKVPVLVDFYATWCGPCKTMTPILEKISAESNGLTKVIKVDVDKNQHAAEQYGVRSVPTLILFKQGKPVWKQAGVVQAAQLKQIIEKYK